MLFHPTPRLFFHKRLLLSSQKFYLYSPVFSTRALSTSLNFQASNFLHLKNKYKNSHRNFSSTPKRFQKKDDDDDDDKNDKNDKNKKAAEKFQKDLIEDWQCLSGFGKFLLMFCGAGLFSILLAESNSFEASTDNKSSTTLNDFSQLLYKDNAKKLVYNNASKTLYFQNQETYKIEKLSGLELNMVKSHIDKLYDSMGLAFANRQHITVETAKGKSDWTEKLASIFKTIFSDWGLTILACFYFSIFLRIKARRSGQPHASPLQTFFNRMQGQKGSPPSGKKGEKGGNKKNSKNNSGGGGFFSSMQNKENSDDIGTLIEPDDIDAGFQDVAGCEEAKIEVIEIVDFLRNRQKYEKAGAEVPKGAIYHGPPGTGKTLLAKACAKEAGVNFIQCSGSDFIEMYVGLGSKRVRGLFEKARDNAPSILFIDEIDSVGGKRGGGGGGGGGHSEANQTINSMLAEMDGFNTGKVPVVVMAATNRLDNIDEALLRPGRFDRKIYVGAPDVQGRAKIFSVHLRKINTKDEKSELAKYLAVKTPGMAGAEIKNICNEAALHSVRNGDPKVTKENFEKATDRVVAGMEKQNNLLDPAVKRRIAIHEAGHAVTSWYLEHCMPLVKVTITPRTEGTLGFAMYQPDTNKVLQEKDYYLDQMVSTLAGRAAEEVFYDGVVSSGAHDDLKKVTASAYQLVMRLGMGTKIRNINYHDAAAEMQAQHIFPSQKTREILDEEIQQLVDDQYIRALALVTEKRDLVEKMADRLMEKETILREDVIEILGERPFADNMTYEAQTRHSADGDFKLPPGLKHWEKSFRYRQEGTQSESSSSEKSDSDTTNKIELKPTIVDSIGNSLASVELPSGWETAYDPDTGSNYYLNSSEMKTSVRHPGKPMPDGWRQELDDEGRICFIHEVSEFKSWSLEGDGKLTGEMRKEIEEFEKRSGSK